MDAENIDMITDEAKVEFKIITDRIVINITSDKVDKPLVEISGYDLKIDINMQYINSLDDVDAATNGIGDLFRAIIMDKLLEYKKQKT